MSDREIIIWVILETMRSHLISREVTEAETEQRGADSRKTGGIKQGWEVNPRNYEVQQKS